MKTHSYIKTKKTAIDIEIDSMKKLYSSFAEKTIFNKRFFTCSIFLILGVVALTATAMIRSVNNVTISEQTPMELENAPIAATSGKTGVITIPSGIVKANPFLPYRSVGNSNVQSDVPKYSLVEPPEIVNENSDAARVMDTVVSGILFDKYSPSAILNIEGTDYLVKKGDAVNNYKVLNITQDSVTVKLGANVYKAGIGEILTEGSVIRNDVANLNKKFGGERR